MPNPVFEIKHLTYNSSDGAIDDINLTVKPGEVHGLIINNSSEQSLFVKAIQEIDKHSKAELYFKDVKYSKNEIPDKNVVIMHQKPQLIKNFSVAENISLSQMTRYRFLPLISWRKLNHIAKEKLEALKFDIDPTTKVYKLSRENKKCVYIASVFNKDPEVIIMHEPMEGLTPDNITKLYQTIQNYVKKGGSVLYITKQWEETLKIATRISILSKGKIIDELSADAAKRDPQRLINKIEKYNYKNAEEASDEEMQAVLDAVIKAAEFLTSEYELKDVLQLLAKEVTKVMNADGCEIHLMDGKTSTIIDQFEHKKIQTKLKIKEETNHKISHNNDIFYSNSDDPNFEKLFTEMDNIKTLISLPVQIRSQITGIIHIFYKDYYVYSKEEFKYLTAFSKHAAIAIEDTRLLGRSALLQESHHRIKNNLQSIVTLISLQKSFLKKEQPQDMQAILNNIINRIKSIAAVHDLLSKDELGRSIIDVKKIIETIVSYTTLPEDIAIHLDLDNILIPYNKATSIALIVNELITNCLKHAFDNHVGGDIVILCKKTSDQIHLSVRDNGSGFPETFDQKKPETLGLSIVYSIVNNEFKGKIELTTEPVGAMIEIDLPTDRIFVHQ